MTSIDALRLMHYRTEPLTFDPSHTYTQRPRSTYGKPVGLWVSVEGDDDWPTWCRNEDFRLDALAVAHEVRLRASADIRLVSSVEEIDRFHDAFAAPTDFDLHYGNGPDEWGIDWPTVVQRYDGIVIAPYLWERRLGSKCDWYYTWDCASGCIWNLHAIESVTVTAEAVKR
ncbi:hypothetical protein [Nocardia otitidiscaviarum]|uniref:hypothetical protein n=1 Tax=Nocardia otitidiscaviarum TaxID=1823 RepID=UPI0005BA3400|nr:hypothetical protein [Nocardia otitidiscaviarum]